MNAKNKYIPVMFRMFIMMTLISLIITGSDCEKILEGGGNVPADIVGSWKLIEQTGAQQDVCPDEVANFQSGGVAQLTCPNSASINRDFSISENILTYTQTSVAYDVEFSNSNQNLMLYGRNVSRNLKYEKIVTDIFPSKKTEINTTSNNSSEAAK